MRTCKVHGCGRPHRARGYCDSCYRRVRRTGSAQQYPRKKLPVPCEIPGCPDPRHARGLCDAHYHRWLNDQDVSTPIAKRGGPCTVEDCAEPRHADGLCGLHYARKRRTGTTDPPPVRLCSVPGCDRRHRRHGYCQLCWEATQQHRSQYRRHLPALIAAAAGRCALCDELVDLSPDAPWVMRPSVDHIVPGNDHRLENLQLAHVSCNAARGNRVDVHHVPPPWARNPALTPTGQLVLL